MRSRERDSPSEGARDIAFIILGVAGMVVGSLMGGESGWVTLVVGCGLGLFGGLSYLK